MERLHNGSSEEGWPKEDSEKIHSEEKRREERRSQEDSEKESDQKAPLASASEQRKAGHEPAFLLCGLVVSSPRQRE